MKKKAVFLFFVLLVVLITLLTFLFLSSKQRNPLLSPLSGQLSKPLPLSAYTFDNLKAVKFVPSEINLGGKIESNENFTSQMFYYKVPNTPGLAPSEQVSGLINIPQKEGIYPVLVMFRGYAPLENYFSGIGTQPSAQIFAKSGYITLAPDFLGYGQSGSSSGEAFENRFQTYTSAITLLESLNNLNSALDASYSGKIRADLTKIGIWGHSNGGQIAITTLEISGLNYPTVLWAPVTKPFPYSILYYTDESDDNGKVLRKMLSEFEKDYDAEKFSLTNYTNWIKAPIELHQGTADEEVPLWWSNEFVEKLKNENIDINYFTYQGSDHNLRPNGWNPAVSESLNFFNSHLQ